MPKYQIVKKKSSKKNSLKNKRKLPKKKSSKRKVSKKVSKQQKKKRKTKNKKSKVRGGGSECKSCNSNNFKSYMEKLKSDLSGGGQFDCNGTGYSVDPFKTIGKEPSIIRYN